MPLFSGWWDGFGFCNLEVDKLFLTVTNALTQESHSHRIIQGEYLNTESTIPKDEPSFTIHIRAKYLIDALRQFDKHHNTVELNFHGDIGAIFVHAPGDKRMHMILPLRK